MYTVLRLELVGLWLVIKISISLYQATLTIPRLCYSRQMRTDFRGYDHIENRNEDTSWYVGEMIARGWDVHTHFLPHDAAHRKGARNETYKQVLATDHGIRNTIVLNKPHRVEDKLNYLRRVFIGLHIDERLERLVECLDKLEYEWAVEKAFLEVIPYFCIA